MTINVPNVPACAPSRPEAGARPPQEIVFGKATPEKPPKTIEVTGTFCPPKEIVVIETKEEARVPNVIQISDMIKAKQDAVVKSLSSTEKAVKGGAAEAKAQLKRKEQRLVEAFDKFQRSKKGSHSSSAENTKNSQTLLPI